MENFKLYGLIGKKLGHSYSADFFNKKFREENIDAEYRLFPLPDITEFHELLKTHNNLCGLNVTVPYKESIIPMLSKLTPEVKDIGAVNVIRFVTGYPEDKIKLIGYNTDVIGFKDSLLPLLSPDVTKALVLGTGGASKAVCYVLRNLGIGFKLVSRTPKKGDLTYSDITPEIIMENLLIVNTTPVGMYPETEDFPPLPYEYITPNHICYDLIYNPENTRFLQLAHARGAKVKNGLEMLKLQAIASWEIWNI